MLKVQEYLLTHSLRQLAEEHGVYARRSTKSSKFGLNYDQLEAVDGDPISQECRGLVLGPAPADDDQIVGKTYVLALPMNRFFNYGQGAAAPVDMNDRDTRFVEKLDGTLCILYWDLELREWCVGTRSVPDADLPMDGFGEQTFSDLFWRSFKESGGRLDACDRDCTYCFELCTPENQVVVRWDSYKVFLLAIRPVVAPEIELDPEKTNIGIEPAQTYRFGSVEEMIDFVHKRDPSSHEGIVVVDKNYRRVKVKNPAYVALGRVRDAAARSPRGLLEIILMEKDDDIGPMLPDHLQAALGELKVKIQNLLHTVDSEYERLWNEDRKTFALAVQAGSGFMGVHMARWVGKCSSMHDWIQKAKGHDGWSNGFLDQILLMARKVG